MNTLVTYELGIGRDGRIVFHGSGFPMRFANRDWLITCQHNLEDDALALTGDVLYPEIQIIQPHGKTVDLSDGRAVVRARVDNVVADCVAIEVSASELPTEAYEHDRVFPFTLASATAATTIVQGLSSTGQVISLERAVKEWLVVAGYPVPAATVQCLLAADVGVPAPQTFMAAYQPGAVSGFSGGPVLRVDGQHASVIGIHTHSYDIESTAILPNGGAAVVASRAGAAVPLTLLKQAITNSTAEGGIIDIS